MKNHNRYAKRHSVPVKGNRMLYFYIMEEFIMGIAVHELLMLEYFKEYEVIAGRKGLQKEIQGVTLLEAPDALRWAKGKELILSSGYVIHQEPQCIENAFQNGSMQGTSAMMIKRGRYLDEIPENIIQLFDQYEIPLIRMPFSVPWMELMSQINTAVMNRTIRRFRIHSNHSIQISDQSYKVQKIRKILQAVEVEMKFPAFLYDLAEKKSYYSSPNFQRITKFFGLKERDYWDPSTPYTKHTLCDYIHMARIRLINPGNMEGPRVSWITIPIIMDGITQAYFVVMESREFIDYYDEFAIRIAFLTLLGVYEQIMIAENMGNIGFENFIHFALNYSEKDVKKLFYQANIQGISINTSYIYIMIHQSTPFFDVRNERKIFFEIFQKSQIGKHGKLAFLDENDGLILVETEKKYGKKWKKETIYELLKEFQKNIHEKFENVILKFGISMEEKTLLDIKDEVEKCRKILKMGKIILPQKTMWDYEMLGPLTWIEIPEDELEHLLIQYKELMKEEKNIELFKTLKVYLENNMNYSTTAEKMYVHINTIRKRIEKMNDLIEIHWEDSISRLKTEILLQFLKLER